ncbi:MAG: 3-phosphoshikimate 1-carboxyvinyltransferase [Candidatus Woesearchaeota archaeon]
MELIEILPWENTKQPHLVKIPGSKSHTQRELIVSALSQGRSTLDNLLECDDSKVMIGALRKSGVYIDNPNGTYIINSQVDTGFLGDVDVGKAGTSMRFLTSYFAALGANVILHGTERMHKRPIEDLVEALKPILDGEIVAESINEKGKRCPPVRIISNGLKGGETKLKGDTSSQYLSSIMMAAPFAYNDIIIDIVGELTSKPYVDMTIAVMRNHNVHVENQNYKRFVVQAGQRYEPKKTIIETDASSLSYVLGAGMLTRTAWGASLAMDLNQSIQGDSKFKDVLHKMSARILCDPDYIELRGPKVITPIPVIDMNNMPDCVQTLAFIAGFGAGYTRITNVANLEEKESKRLTTLHTELGKIGISSEVRPDGIIIYGTNPKNMHSAEIETYEDHRVAMNAAIAGLVIPGIRIKDPMVTTKSWPTFFEDMGIQYKVIR